MRHTKGVTTLAQFDYTLNNVGNRTTKNATGSIPNRNESYTYDAIDQVTGTTATGTNPNTQTFAYDAAGNRTSVGATNAAPGTGTYTTNALNQYTALGAEVLLYDINGNLTTQGLSASYSYDSKNRLIGASKGIETMSATYDYQNRQVSRTMNNGVSYFIYDGWNLIGEYTANGSMWQKHIHGAATDEILAKTDWAGTFYYHHDGLGSTVALTNSSGNVIESYLYDVYGKPTVLNASNTAITASAFGNRFLFTGREWIRRIEIYDYRNRVYSPDLGRFLQTDPIRFDAGDVNTYRYVGNGVTQLTDAMRLCPDDAEWEEEDKEFDPKPEPKPRSHNHYPQTISPCPPGYDYKFVRLISNDLARDFLTTSATGLTTALLIYTRVAAPYSITGGAAVGAMVNNIGTMKCVKK